jgi:predicted dehydrogenase
VSVCAVIGTPAQPEPAAPSYPDVRVMAEEQTPDLVIVCLPDDQACTTALTALEAGLPVLVQMPLTGDLPQVQAVVAAAEEPGAFAAAALNHRYARAVELAFRRVRDGDLGQLLCATWRCYGGVPLVPAADDRRTDEQCHAFDLLELLCGPVRSVSAHTEQRTGDHALALTFAQGGIGSVVGSSGGGGRRSSRLELAGTAGVLQVEDEGRTFRYRAAGKESTEVWRATELDHAPVDTMALLLDDVLCALRQGDPPPVPLTVGYRALQLTTAAHQSASTGRRVDVPGPAAGG